MDCQELDRLLEEHPLAALSPEQRQAVAAHVADCERCRQKWGLDQHSQVLHDAAKPLSSESSVRAGVMARLGDDAPGKASPTPATPQRLAGFELLGRIGKGGMGTVLKARQISMDRLVALKILPKRLAQNREFVARFIREARSAARLRHRHIVQAIDVGKSEGYYYFAMELVDGHGLDTIVLREGRLEQNRALRYMRQVCSALAAAHKAGIVHRDIKPSNLLIDSDDQVRVADFGLARRVEDDITVTTDGQTLGTPAYVSPEMARGKEADARSDLYSLGATFYHTLAGRPPFAGRTFGEVLVKQATEPPTPLAEAAPHVDRRLCRIIDRLLAKSPDERCSSAQALLDALEALGELREHVERPKPAVVKRRPKHGGTAMRRRSTTKARPTALLVAGVGAALVVAAIVVFLLARPGAPPREQPTPGAGAQAAFEAAEAYRAQQPRDLDGAIGRFQAVCTTFPGTAWASRAAAKVQELERAKQQLAAEARARQALEREVSALRAECRALAGSDRFGAALEKIEAFRKKHPTGSAATQARELSLEMLGKAQERYAELLRAADAALGSKDYAKARAALRPALAFGIDRYADQARQKLAEIDERETKAEHWAKWEAVKALDAAKRLPLTNIAALVAEQAEAVEAVRQGPSTRPARPMPSSPTRCGSTSASGSTPRPGSCSASSRRTQPSRWRRTGWRGTPRRRGCSTCSGRTSEAASRRSSAARSPSTAPWGP